MHKASLIEESKLCLEICKGRICLKKDRMGDTHDTILFESYSKFNTYRQLNLTNDFDMNSETEICLNSIIKESDDESILSHVKLEKIQNSPS